MELGVLTGGSTPLCSDTLRKASSSATGPTYHMAPTPERADMQSTRPSLLRFVRTPFATCSGSPRASATSAQVMDLSASILTASSEHARVGVTPDLLYGQPFSAALHRSLLLRLLSLTASPLRSRSSSTDLTSESLAPTFPATSTESSVLPPMAPSTSAYSPASSSTASSPSRTNAPLASSTSRVRLALLSDPPHMLSARAFSSA